jgi:hypothetical protein
MEVIKLGTNYYLHTDICPCCRRPGDVIHIGKQSGGWAFSVRGYDYLDDFNPKTQDFFKMVLNISNILTWSTWKRIIKLMPKSWKIKNEYGKIVGRTTFIKNVEDSYKYKKNKRHADKYPSERDYIDNDGYSITETEFS